jgi:hypothetical protein
LVTSERTLAFGDVVELIEIDAFFNVDILSVLSVGIIDVDVAIKSRGSVGFTSLLLLLLSFKLKRRTGFFRIRLMNDRVVCF